MTHASHTARLKRILSASVLVGCAAMLAAPVQAKTAPAPVSVTTLSDTQESDLRLALDKVNLAAETGKIDEAYQMLDKLKTRYPNNADVMAAERDLTEQQTARHNIGFSEFCAPNSLDPYSLDLLQHERKASLARGGYTCAGYNRRVTSESYEQISSLTGQVAVPFPGLSLNFDLENVHANTTTPFVRANGTEQSFYGNRQQGTVMLQKTFQNHDQAGISVYGNNATAGAGLQYVFTDRYGGTSIQANYNQPDWDYIESVVQDGTKDDFRIERKQVFSPNFQAVLSAGVTHYSLSNFWSAADAPGWNFALDYIKPIRFSDQHSIDDSWMNDEFTFGAHYGVDAEYFTFVNHRTDRTGDVFNPLPTTTYELHSFLLSVGKTILPNVDAELDGGYGYNRINGGTGPIYGGSLTYTPWQHLGIDIHASRTLVGGQNNGGKEDITGASLKWIW